MAGDIRGILLAAGSASRFGSDKLMHPLPDGTPIAVAAARNLLAALPDSIAVVRSADSELAGLLRAEGLRVEECADAAEGMGRTLAAGVLACREAEGWVVALADMPFVSPDTIRRVADALGAGAELAAPIYRGTRGHPVAFGARYRAELASLTGDAGARAVLKRDQSRVRGVAVDDPGVLRDIDTPEDLAAQ